MPDQPALYIANSHHRPIRLIMGASQCAMQRVRFSTWS